MHKLRSDILSAGQDRPSPVAAKTTATPKPRVASLGASLAAIPVKRTESRTTNQREGDRVPGVIADTTLTVRRRKMDARVVNLSCDGAMIEVDVELHIGERVAISLGDGGSGKCVVRWIRGGRIGLEFDGFSLELGQGPEGFAFRRSEEAKRKIAERATRQALVWRATLHHGPDSTPVRLANVSTTGALLEGAPDVEVGASVLIDLSGAGMMPSTVRWAEGGRVGVLFDREFDVQLLSICAAHDAAPKKIDWVKPEYLTDERNPNSPHAGRWEKLTLEDLPWGPTSRQSPR